MILSLTTVLIVFSSFYSYECIKFVNTIKYQDLITYDRKCSHLKLKTYQKNYFLTEKFSLFRYFSTLQKLKCYETIKNECNRMTFNYNDYTNYVYDRFCDRNEIKNKCVPLINNQLKLDKTYLFQLSWKNVTELSLNLSIKKIKNKEIHNCYVLVVLENLEKLPELEIFEKKKFNFFKCFAWELTLTDRNTNIDITSVGNR